MRSRNYNAVIIQLGIKNIFFPYFAFYLLVVIYSSYLSANNHHSHFKH
ncbi:hypothetical protein THOB06_160042 [Vibrio rotiferianus]|nr:hypothetical protein THOG10_160042 [Vibrio rotiferianus]CAH1567595.1 hypothetical protein THOB06_160042 [Vibrio rotiferianus]